MYATLNAYYSCVLFRLSCFHGFQTQSNYFFSDDIFHIFHNFQRREFANFFFVYMKFGAKRLCHHA